MAESPSPASPSGDASGPDGLPAPGLAAGTPRPPYAFAVDMPDHWTVVDLDPLTRGRWVDAFLTAKASGRGGDRASARAALLDYLGQLEREQVLLAAILFGEAGGEPVSAGVTLAWRRLGGGPAAPDAGTVVEGLRRYHTTAAPEPGEDRAARRVERVELRLGEGVKVTSAHSVRLPSLPAPRTVRFFQYFIPAGDGWLAVVTASTGVPAMAEGVGLVAAEVASSLRLDQVRA